MRIRISSRLLIAQGQRLWHTSNLFQIPQAEELARRLVEATFADFVFFTNSGTEALEGAVKTARKYHYVSGHPEKVRIITLEGAFHGRSLAALAAGGNPKYLEGFEPRLDGFDQVPFGDLDAVKAAIGPRTGAILVEPIQGEGGVRVLPQSFLDAIRRLCDDHGLLLIFDEVQTGVGRTGPLFAYQRVGVTPDIMMIAKGIGGGFPLGAFLVTRQAGKGMTLGSHGTTYGGNPLATAIGNAVLDIVLAEGFLTRSARMGALLKEKLAELQGKYRSVIAEVRGEGLLLGLKTHVPIADFVAAALKEKIIVIGAADNVARVLPPLIVSEMEIAEGLRRLEAATSHFMQDFAKGHAVERSGRMINGATNGTDCASLRHFLDLSEMSAVDLRRILETALAIKRRRRKGELAAQRPLIGKVLAMIFDKPSTRTRVSFDVAMRELGGETIMLTGQEMQLGRGETIADTARVLSRFVDAIVIRVLDVAQLTELAAHADVPVINGLTKKSHPCQVLADVMTFEEHRGSIKGRTIAWSGDSNNVLASWIHAAQKFDFSINVATPAELDLAPELVTWARGTKTRLTLTRDPYEAARGADAVISDCWVSMGDEDESFRHNLLGPYQVNAKLMSVAAKDAIFMHCLPAHRGEEVTDEVIDGPQSVVFDEAENRLHAQKGILSWCFGVLEE